MHSLLVGFFALAVAGTASAQPVLPAPAVAPPDAAVSPDPGIFLGYYPDVGARDQASLAAFDSWLGFNAPVLGDFASFDAYADLRAMTQRLVDYWNRGSVTLLNVETHTWTTAELAAGAADDRFIAFANALADFHATTGGHVLVALLPEANGDWAAYGCRDGDGQSQQNFVAAYRRGVQTMAAQLAARGVARGAVAFVWAPNGWTPRGCGSLSSWYPGRDVVDVVGMSSFNFGTARSSRAEWESVGETVLPAIDAVVDASCGEPVVVSQVGSSSSGGDREAWIADLFAGAAARPEVRGIVWFNLAKLEQGTAVDWRIWDGASGSEAYRVGAAALPARDGRPLDLFGQQEGFCDVPQWHPYYGQVERLADMGLVAGCGEGWFCPEAPVTRAQAAALTTRAARVPVTPGTPTVFLDVPEDAYYQDGVTALAALGATVGCGPGLFCPDQPATRGEAAMLVAGALGLDASAAGPQFADVPVGHPAAGAIMAVARVGLASGCGAGMFCPDSPITRGELAALLAWIGAKSRVPAPLA